MQSASCLLQFMSSVVRAWVAWSGAIPHTSISMWVVFLILVIFAQFHDLLFYAECVVLVVVHVERGQDVIGVEWCNTTHINLNVSVSYSCYFCAVWWSVNSCRVRRACCSSCRVWSGREWRGVVQYHTHQSQCECVLFLLFLRSLVIC
jgi:hypothetical protein